MNYNTEHIAAALKAARQNKGLSQRALSALSGVPQAHISKIEGNTVDLRLSSLIALASALDLELTLIPRKAVPAIKSIARSTSAHGADPQAINELARTRQALMRAQGAFKHIPDLRSLVEKIDQLQPLHLKAIDAETLRSIRRTVEKLDANVAASPAMQRALRAATDLRNRLVHIPADPEQALPAYRLDEDEHG